MVGIMTGVFNVLLQGNGHHTVGGGPDGIDRVNASAFVGLEIFTGIAAFFLLSFLRVEKSLPKEQAEIKARRAGYRSADSESWIKEICDERI